MAAVYTYSIAHLFKKNPHKRVSRTHRGLLLWCLCALVVLLLLKDCCGHCAVTVPSTTSITSTSTCIPIVTHCDGTPLPIATLRELELLELLDGAGDLGLWWLRLACNSLLGLLLGKELLDRVDGLLLLLLGLLLGLFGPLLLLRLLWYGSGGLHSRRLLNLLKGEVLCLIRVRCVGSGRLVDLLQLELWLLCGVLSRRRLCLLCLHNNRGERRRQVSKELVLLLHHLLLELLLERTLVPTGLCQLSRPHEVGRLLLLLLLLLSALPHGLK